MLETEIMPFGKRLQTLRRKNPNGKIMKVEELARLLDISPSKLRNIESGRDANLTPDAFRKLKQIFGVSYRFLFEGIEEVSKDNVSEPHDRIITRLQQSDELAFLVTELLTWDNEGLMLLLKTIVKASQTGYDRGYRVKEGEIKSL